MALLQQLIFSMAFIHFDQYLYLSYNFADAGLKIGSNGCRNETI